MEPLQHDILGYRLLYVDDDERSINFISKIITRRYPGLKLFIAENGAKGLELYREQRPDIVLTDMYMPVMDGIQMAKEIKSINAEAVIIAVTGYNDPTYLRNAIEIGIRHYVMKPLIQENLFAVIDKSIEEISLNRLVREQGQVIRQREQQLALAQKITRLGSWELDIESGKMSWSEELYRIFGIDPTTTTPSLEVFLGMVHPTARDEVKTVTLAIDNFGCGSSSIQWMRKMPIHKVIIDKSFVHTMLSEPDDLAVINAVIAMSHNLRINVGAIGIETKEQLSVIERSGCDQLQGYVISEPLSADDFERFVVGF